MTLTSEEQKALDIIGYAILVVAQGHDVGDRLEAVQPICHRDADPGGLQQLVVVSAVAEGHRLRGLDAQMGT